jgi:hypothetical protein
MPRQMPRHALVGILLSAFLLGSAPAHAGPCTAAIARFENLIGRSQASSEIAPSAPQTVGAQLGHQPTPASVGRAEKRAQSNLDAALARAKTLDARGNRACRKALKQAKLMSTTP